jgi:hypothetical protein
VEAANVADHDVAELHGDRLERDLALREAPHPLGLGEHVRATCDLDRAVLGGDVDQGEVDGELERGRLFPDLGKERRRIAVDLLRGSAKGALNGSVT